VLLTLRVQAIRALRALRALRPLRIIKRFDALKIVVNSLINVVPDVVNVVLLCVLFFLMFGVILVGNLKGTFMACQGDVFDAAVRGTPKEALLVAPVRWEDLTPQQHSWFGCNATAADANAAAGGGGGGGGSGGADENCAAQDAADYCADWPSSSGGGGGGDGGGGGVSLAPTSKVVCGCFGATWGVTAPQNFDNIYNALSAL